MTIKFTKTMYSWFCVVAMLAFGTQLQAQTSEIVIGSGAAAGTYNTATAMFSGAFAGESGELIFPDDGTGTATACMAVTNDLTGKIAIIDRGACAFATKAINVQTAGAIGAVICNSVGSAGLPSSWIGDLDGAITIPVFGLDSTACAPIKIAMGTETVSATFNGPGAGETCITAYDVTDGTHSVTMSTAGFGGGLFNGAMQATWYSYTAPMDGIMNITSCGGGADTRLIGMAAPDCEGTLDPLVNGTFWFSIDDCDDGAGNIVASNIDIIVAAGDAFKFFWDDAQSSDGFDFTIGTSAFPMVNGTVSVDMSNETVDASGVFVNGSITGGVATAMTDNMDGTYSYTFATQTNDAISYSFYNGAAQEDVAGLTDCGDGTARMSTVLATADFSIPVVCFGECGLCPVGCGDPSIIICDDFDDYDLGNVGPQANHWSTWGGVPDAADEGAVSDEQSVSGTQSLKISDADPDDAILVLGDRTEGSFALSWEMYIPAGSSAYWNIQKITEGFSGAGANFNMETFMDADGTGRVNVVTASAATYTYPQDEWFTMAILFGLDSDLNTLFIQDANGDLSPVHSWPASETVSSGPGEVRIGSIDYFGNTGNLYYIDDVIFEEVNTGDLCFNHYDIAPLFGGDLDAPQTSMLFSNIGYDTEEGLDPETGWECWGEPDGGGAAPSLETSMWYSFVGDGATYSITTTECNATDFIDDGDTQMALYSGSCDNLVAVSCNEDAPGVDPAGPYPAQIDIETVEGETYYLLIDAFTFNGTTSDGEFCVEVTKTADAPPPMYAVTFNVDLELVDMPDVAHVAGSFNNFTGEPMTLVADQKYTLTKMIEAGTYTYKFQNGLGVWEDGIEGDCTVGGYGDREVAVTDMAIDIAEVCYEYCADCQTVDVNETSLRNGIKVFPNPANDFVNVNYGFNEAIDLEVNVYNSLGQLMNRVITPNAIEGSLTLNIADLAAGVYMLEFTNGNVATSQRLIVQ